MKRLIACLLAFLPSIALAQQPDSHRLLKAAALGIVTNHECSRQAFTEAQIVAWIFSGSVEAGLGQGQAVDITRLYVAQILSGLTTSQKMNAFCNEMFKIVGEPT